ncbi:MAG TPA: helix-turn-helix domain-containing protein [Candidatus Anoxymicrobiaceae bacterium]
MSPETRLPDGDPFKALADLGFSDYEAKAYCALLAQAPANGYQVARESGVPRAKVYETLEKLVARGAAVRVEGKDQEGRLFAPTTPDQLIGRIEQTTRSACEEAREALERFQSDPRVVEVLWRVTSQSDLIARGKSLTEGAAHTLHIALWAEEFDILLPSLLEAMDRGVKVAMILYSTHRGLKRLVERGAGAVQHTRSKHHAVPVMGRQFVLVADRDKCITGSIFSEENVEGVFTLNKGLVTNAIDLVNHEIFTERILVEVGKPVWDVFGKYLGRLNEFDPPQQ